MHERRTRRSRERGFTLVEMMVVIVIIGILAAAVVLALPDPSGGVRLEAERFAARLKAAQDESVLGGRATSVAVDGDGYVFARSENGRWRETDRFRWDDGTRPDLAGPPLRAAFDPTGGADALEVILRRRDTRVMVRIGADGRVALQP